MINGWSVYMKFVSLHIQNINKQILWWAYTTEKIYKRGIIIFLKHISSIKKQQSRIQYFKIKKVFKLLGLKGSTGRIDCQS